MKLLHYHQAKKIKEICRSEFVGNEYNRPHLSFAILLSVFIIRSVSQWGGHLSGSLKRVGLEKLVLAEGSGMVAYNRYFSAYRELGNEKVHISTVFLGGTGKKTSSYCIRIVNCLNNYSKIDIMYSKKKRQYRVRHNNLVWIDL